MSVLRLTKISCRSYVGSSYLRGRPLGDGADHSGPVLEALADGKNTANNLRPVLHNPQPEALALSYGIRKARLVVPDAQDDLVASFPQADVNSTGLAVFNGIGYGLLCDAKEVRLDRQITELHR